MSSFSLDLLPLVWYNGTRIPPERAKQGKRGREPALAAIGRLFYDRPLSILATRCVSLEEMESGSSPDHSLEETEGRAERAPSFVPRREVPTARGTKERHGNPPW